MTMVTGHRVGSSVVAGPEVEQAAEVGEELLVLVRRVGGLHGVDEQLVEVRAGDPVVHLLVEVRQVLRAPVAVALGVEVLVGKRQVRLELGVVVERVVVGDREVPVGVQVDPGTAARSRAQNADQRTSAVIAHGK